MNSIIDFLPRERQTLLFSATQTRSIKDLARLSLKVYSFFCSFLPAFYYRAASILTVSSYFQTPEFISDMQNDVYSLPPPEQLQQSLMVVPLWEKMNCLWSFLKSHLSGKIVVFVSFTFICMFKF